MSLCFPFEWCHVNIPVLPVRLKNVLDAPVPFIVGVHEDSLDSFGLSLKEIDCDSDNDKKELVRSNVF